MAIYKNSMSLQEKEKQRKLPINLFYITANQ